MSKIAFHVLVTASPALASCQLAVIATFLQTVVIILYSSRNGWKS
jgi:hypothetical protein